MQENTTVKIIIADDEERIRRLVSDFLTMAGYAPIQAADGSEALEAFRKNPDAKLMILDIMMPEMDGWAACRELRKISDIPVIMLTDRAEEFDQLTAFEAGADEYVTKPFSPAVPSTLPVPTVCKPPGIRFLRAFIASCRPFLISCMQVGFPKSQSLYDMLGSSCCYGRLRPA